MYEQPVLFPAVSSRETWLVTVSINDDDTGELVSLTDDSGVALYAIIVEIMPPRGGGYYSGIASPYYDECGGVTITATLNDYLSIIDTGTVEIRIPYTVMQSLDSGKTYDVFMRVEDVASSDARQILIGKLPVLYGGRTA